MDPEVLNNRLLQLELMGSKLLSQVDELILQIDSFKIELESLNEESTLYEHIASPD